MAEEKGKTNGSGNGSGAPAGAGNGGKKSAITTLIENSRQIKERALQELETYKQPEKTDVWKSALRVKHDETPRSRALCPNSRFNGVSCI